MSDIDAGTATITHEHPALSAGRVAVESDDHEVVPAALRQLRAAARDCCHATSRSSVYSPDLAVEVLTDTTAALAQLAECVAPYAGDFWPTAGKAVDAAVTALTDARHHLDTARHHITLTPPRSQLVTTTD